MGRKKKPAEEPSHDRVELQAPLEWVKQLDVVAKSLGISRSAFIRQACNEKMVRVRREMGLVDEKPIEP